MVVKSSGVKVKAIDDHAQGPMTMDGAQGVTMRMLIGPDEAAPHFHMRHFTVQPGGHSPHHSHDYEHEVLILKGTGILKSDQGDKPLKANDAVYVPANATHQFQNTGPDPLEFICLIPAPKNCAV